MSVSTAIAGLDLASPAPKKEPSDKSEDELPEDVLPLFPHPLDDHTTEVITWREQYLRNFSCAIRNKPNWTEKILDRTLVVKWIREAQDQTRIWQWKKILAWNQEDIEFAYKELVEGYKPFVDEAKKKPELYGLEPDMDCVWRSDSLVDEELRKELIEAVATLENVPEDQKDWHPGSSKQVLDLVHPSLWPVIYGRSISLIDGKPIESPDNAIDTNFSEKFCWLPSEFEVGADGKVKIASYINNLSTGDQQKLFYPILERIFQRFVPLFNHVLGDLKRGFQHWNRAYSPDSYTHDSEEIEWLFFQPHKEKFNEVLGQFERGEELTVKLEDYIHVFPDTPEGDKLRDDLGEDYWEEPEDDEDIYDDEKREQRDTAPYQVRDLGWLNQNRTWTPPEITDSIKLEGKTAKVIVKLANIILTPEQPIYEGGSWHVEAMMNERIVSTGIYYYDQENITESELAFRRTIESMEDMGWQLPQDSNWTTVHNMGSSGTTVQEIGGIKTQNNRAIAFPNIYQHQVQPFELVDKTKPGYRKVLVFFLCDPSEENEVPTSKTVAPQQPEARKDLVETLRQGPLGNLPEEVFRLIVEALPPVVTREEAEKYRDELMYERSSFINDSEAVQGESYSLCEH
ncbi:hypothetical protein TWF569_006690 [Orbilia oligospora]|uniref:Uncharacterized protein n=1 Tax=Orbilia oligospora TaxID=2813651 RepID=A0A7C8NRV1_ORBOL|nr:hypothetical protein TWF102_005268 [Orbilia oligospora]KAF3101855.1 hypothetical protein TWF103_007844 [Orbilia oligospora]KAF3111720.1 hypothetical protein TWF706_011456 [Orbilia oligospora]KAF3133628.1 hypothetical protein TWF703_006685 [Orbilia oligospora]KAF3140070.1 hypothetical protein TWF594_006460 [Orbilia oligospora]